MGSVSVAWMFATVGQGDVPKALGNQTSLSRSLFDIFPRLRSRKLHFPLLAMDEDCEALVS